MHLWLPPTTPAIPTLSSTPYSRWWSRVYGILGGYEDLDDHDTLRAAPVFKVLADRSPDDSDLASQPPLCHFENAFSIAAESGASSFSSPMKLDRFATPRNREGSIR
jgi:hypothetical protein